MPRLTSFDGIEDQSVVPGNEWSITLKQGFIFTRYYARSGDRVVELGLITCNKKRSIRAKSTLTGPFRYELKLTLNGYPSVIYMTMNQSGGYKLEPNMGSISKVGPRTHLILNGIGKGIYRSAWKDSDVAKNIVGFINVECDDPENEEELVWLAGSIGRHGLDLFFPTTD